MFRRRVLLLNLLLLVAVIVCAQQLISAWASFSQEHDLERIVASAQQGARAEQIAPVELKGNPALVHDYFVISERDLFRSDRRPKLEDDAEEVVQEAPKFPKRPEMHGATTSGGTRKAFLTVFDSANDKGDTRTVGIGDAVQGYTVSEITDTTLTLRWNEQVELIDMLDASSVPQAARPAPKMAVVNIIRIGSRHAAVESTTASTPEPAESRGLQVGVVGGQRTGVGAASARGMTGGASRMPGSATATGRAGRMGTTSSGRSFPSTVGTGGSIVGMRPNQ
jgi:hypothetical protein